jgi:hypothetical protein
MDQEHSESEKKSSKKSSHVRFTDQELAQIEKDVRVRGRSIPTLLKEAYFEGRPTAVLMTQEEQQSVMTELLRQGNNLNQIARKVNAGISENVMQEVAAIRRAMTGLMALIRGKVAAAKA